MTCREKLKLEHPHWDDAEVRYYIRYYCPHGFKYAEMPDWCVGLDEAKCTECWDREIPETETINNKEKEIMPISAAKASKMTKAQMLEEIERANATIYEMEQELKNLEKYKQYEEAADEIKAIHTALMNSGFSNDQAFELLKTTMQSMMPSILRGMRL